jgi:hypothetical protein
MTSEMSLEEAYLLGAHMAFVAYHQYLHETDAKGAAMVFQRRVLKALYRRGWASKDGKAPREEGQIGLTPLGGRKLEELLAEHLSELFD